MAIPYSIHISQEAYYHSLLFLILKLLQFNVQSEVMIATGRLDLIVSFPKQTLLFEFKFDKTANKALNQIENHQYYLQFKKSHAEIILIGANFNRNFASSERMEIQKNRLIFPFAIHSLLPDNNSLKTKNQN